MTQLGPQGQVRPSDTVENAILVAKLATGEIEETYQSPSSDEENAAPEGLEPSPCP